MFAMVKARRAKKTKKTHLSMSENRPKAGAVDQGTYIQQYLCENIRVRDHMQITQFRNNGEAF